ncbi:MAG: hypothetical protein P1V35_12505 [Planctomycetota bacterium]|nr:hypothetical protein [Planctomycetota bacterium]
MRLPHIALVLLTTGFLMTESASAQSDDCASATPITGLGSHPFSNLNATDSGLGCLGTADLFWEWTPPVPGDYLFEVIYPVSAFDATLGILPAPCGTTGVLGCNIAPYSLGGLLLSDAMVGQSYLIQISGFGGVRGSGELLISESPCDPTFNTDDMLEDNDTVATAAPITPGAYANLYISDLDPDFYSVVIPAHTNLTVQFPGIPSAHRTTVYSTTGVVLGTGYNGLHYRPQSPTPMTVVIGIAIENNYSTRDTCGNYDMTVSTPPAPTEYSSFCIPTQANSAGTAAHLEGWRNAPQYGSRIVLSCYNGPPGQFGYYLVSTQFSNTGIPLGQGQLCLAGNLGRYNVAGTAMNSTGIFDSSRSFQNGSGTGYFGHGFIPPMDLPMGGMIATGQTWHFQVWYREPMGNSNFSNGLSVTF